MLDRGSIKWAPFNSVVDGNILVKEIICEKSKIPKPILSEEQIGELEKNIFEAMTNKTPLFIDIYQNGLVKRIKDKIVKIDSVKKKIYLEKYKPIYFCAIIKINISF